MRRSLLTRVIAGLCVGGLMSFAPARADDAPAADVTAVGQSTQAVAASFYAQYKDREGNLCLSPYALSLALGTVHAGAHGATQAELTKALGLTLPAERVAAAQSALAKAVTATANGTTRDLKTQLALWTQVPPGDAFAAVGKDQYGAVITPTDFAADPTAARTAINTAIGEETGGAVTDIVRPGMLREHTRLVTYAGLSFRADWENGFVVSEISDAYFLVTPTRAAPVKMMNKTDTFLYAETDEAQIVSLPFKDGKQSLIIILPPDARKLQAIEGSLSAEKLQQWQGALKKEMVHISLPRFSLHTARDVAIPLEGLGLKTVFDREAADFSGIAGAPGEMALGPVLHRAAITVDERGEVQSVSAATRLLMGNSGNNRNTKRLNADHPFLFVLRDDGTGAILLIGRLVDPAKQ